MKTLLDTKCLVVWEHDGKIAVWVRGKSQMGQSRYGRMYGGECGDGDWSVLMADMTCHEAEEWLRLKWGVEVPATEDDVGRMVMVRDSEENSWQGPRKLRAVLPDRNSPYITNAPCDGVCMWRLARLATDEECKGVKE